MRSFIALLVLAVLLIWLGWLLNDLWYSAASKSKKEAPPQSVAGTTIVPPKPIVAATPSQQETARASTSPCCCPCPQKTKAATHPKKKRIQRPKPVPPVTSETAVASGTKGCREIRFMTKTNEPAVQVGFFASSNRDVATTPDVCMAKNEGRLLDCTPKELCDFSRAAVALGKKFLMAKTYPTTEGEHVLYVPEKFLDPKEGIVTMLVLVKGNETPPVWHEPSPYSATAAYQHNEEVVRWMKLHYSDGICVGHFDYSFKGVATVYHSKAEMPAGVRIQMYFPDVGTSLFD